MISFDSPIFVAYACLNNRIYTKNYMYQIEKHFLKFLNFMEIGFYFFFFKPGNFLAYLKPWILCYYVILRRMCKFLLVIYCYLLVIRQKYSIRF